jgi:hypothetical protein
VSIRKNFERFHRENPHVYVLLVQYARQVKAAGVTHYAIATLFERVRWHLTIDTKSRDGFKLNNNYRAHYARLIMAQEHDLAGLFELREIHS